MAKRSSGKNSITLLRVSGLLFAFTGLMHFWRYYRHWEFRIGSFELTPVGSLIAGILLLFLAGACFWNSKK